ncbi:MAG: malonyl-CoA synthase, partial [Gammaproteobacteria bacterium]|nr:malonyl-CoA synthase [Gammaproteobacteria bacterium]
MTGNANLYSHFQQHFPADLNTQLLTDVDGCRVTYLQADKASARIANTLLQLGAVRGDRIT